MFHFLLFSQLSASVVMTELEVLLEILILRGWFTGRNLLYLGNSSVLGKFMATQYFLIIIRLQFQWLEFHIKIQGMAGKQCAFYDQKGWKNITFF